jgi:CheY-like chemotaxis protein
MKKINAISIIDDDPITIFGIKKMLDALGICDTIITYSNGKLAIDGIRERIAANQDVPDVIFLDINMPIMDGWQFLEEFITIPLEKSVHINIVTSSIDPVDRQNWEFFKNKTHHRIDFKNKPIRQKDIEEITAAA